MKPAPIDLPAEFSAFLKQRKQLRYDADECDCGRIRLLAKSKLRETVLVVEPEQPDDSLLDPHGEDDGAYVIRAINLVGEADGFDPDYILCWLPEQQIFASYDIDHRVLHIFPGTTWTQIADNPVPYLNAQWRDAGDCPGARMKPWEHVQFRVGWLEDDAEQP